MNQVLIVDDEAAMRAALEAHFRRQGWRVTTAASAEEALTRFREQPCPLVVTDMRMPGGDGLSVMRGVRALEPTTGVIFLTAFGNVPEAVAAMRYGACDYLVKPVSFERLHEAATRVLAEPAGITPVEVEAAPVPAAPINEWVRGDSPLMLRAWERARQVAQTDADVLVEAESGTGKEVLARYIHQSSLRANRPFVAVNCSAFPDNLLESELFGHVRGAFTGAAGTKPGKFELANGGTILLDEIGDMPLALQPKLLRVLQEREVDRLGDTRSIPIDVRVIATTNQSLSERIASGLFRADLYYRLNVIPLSLPPLRARRADIVPLAEHFVRKYAGARTVRFHPDLMARMQAFDWPGNVRELENFVRRALALSSGIEITEADVELPGDPHPLATPAPAPSARIGLEAGTSLKEAERQLLVTTLNATGGNRTRAAEMLGVSLRTIRNKIREYSLPPRSYAS